MTQVSSCFDFFGSTTVCPNLPGHVQIWQKQEGNGPIDERRRINLASDLKSVNSITCISMFIWSLMVASEATTASKQPQRSNLTSELKSVTSITYVSMSICAVIALISKMQRRRRHLPPIDFAVAIAPLVKINQGGQVK